MSSGIDYSKWDKLDISDSDVSESDGDEADGATSPDDSAKKSCSGFGRSNRNNDACRENAADDHGELPPSLRNSFPPVDYDKLPPALRKIFGPGKKNRGGIQAEECLLGRGVPYEKKNGWLVTGKTKEILVHPEDTWVAAYPPAIFEEDPHTFVPDPRKFSDGCVEKWGLKELPKGNCRDDGEAHLQSLSVIADMEMMSWGSTIYKERSQVVPVEQFIDILIDRKRRRFDVQAKSSEKSTYVLKIELCECEEDVWRRVKVPSSIDLSKLHDQVLVPVMGWARGYHGYAYQDKRDGTAIGPVTYGGYIDTMHVPMAYYKLMDDREVPLSALLSHPGDSIQYTYDIGDNWRHTIVLEGIVQEEDSVTLLAGKGACPPEDSNGIEAQGKSCEGYAKFLAAYKRNPKKKDMKKAVREASQSQNYASPWLGGPPIAFKPLHFDICYHRNLLRHMLLSPSVKRSMKSFLEHQGYHESTRACEGCGTRLKTLLRCTACEKVSYCSKECQVQDWKSHKKDCKKHRHGRSKGKK